MSDDTPLLSLPMILPAMITMSMLSLIATFNSFDIIWILTRGGPSGETTTMIIDTYHTAIGSKKYGEGAARAVLICIFLSIFSVAYFRVTNTSDRPISGTAAYNVVPERAGPYFQKLQCFCFEAQTVQPGETVEPVSRQPGLELAAGAHLVLQRAQRVEPLGGSLRARHRDGLHADGILGVEGVEQIEEAARFDVADVVLGDGVQ